ncbi:MAG: hypothetical protein COB78_09935 [Hyphomicrobiales bacterium]|nr:MAG: hypothetical protein COB78_09935 [Hyphomicrobiales bacterium]
MAEEWTKGEWVAKENPMFPNQHIVVGDDNEVVVHFSKGRDGDWPKNIHLISASKDLYAALEGMTKMFVTHVGNAFDPELGRAMIAARAAQSKARGGKPGDR